MYALRAILITILALWLVERGSAQTNYCKANLCGGKKHIACNNKGKFSPTCARNAKIVRLTKKMRNIILHNHNKLRNRVAQGGFQSYKSAVRMATMRWSPELAKLAVYNVKQCSMKHDKCRNTRQFPYAGQNIAKQQWSGKNRAIGLVAREQILSWFEEWQKCSMGVIKDLKSVQNCGHFTVMMQEKNTHVGCAILRQKKNGRFMQLITCNYAYTNMFDMPVYRDGEPASKCKTGKNKKYKALCSLREKYNLKTASL